MGRHAGAPSATPEEQFDKFQDVRRNEAALNFTPVRDEFIRNRIGPGMAEDATFVSIEPTMKYLADFAPGKARFKHDLYDNMGAAMDEYYSASAVYGRRHGLNPDFIEFDPIRPGVDAAPRENRPRVEDD